MPEMQEPPHTHAAISAGVEVVHADDILLEPLTPPMRPRMRQPYAGATAVARDTDVELGTLELEEGGWPPFSEVETIRAGIAVLGSGGGEWWHEHLSFHEVILYVESGQGTIWWNADGQEHKEDVTRGDFISIAPGVSHKWLNTGGDEMRVIWFGHCHRQTH